MHVVLSKHRMNRMVSHFSMRQWWLLLVQLPALLRAQNDFSCDADNDPCPFQLDGECDSEFGTNIRDCLGADCADCDVCAEFNLECDACLANGCYWCATSGICTNWDGYRFPGTQCVRQEDFVRDTCSPPDNFFR